MSATPAPTNLKRDARTWASLTGLPYTQALVQMQDPRLGGILGPRIHMSAVEAVLKEEVDLGVFGVDAEERLLLGPDGRLSVGGDPLKFLIEVFWCGELLRLLAPRRDTRRDTEMVSSYRLKHLAEDFFPKPHSYIANGQLILAAYVLEMETEYEPGSPNIDIELDAGHYGYMDRVIRGGRPTPTAHHHRPAGLDRLTDGLGRDRVVAARVLPGQLGHFPEQGEYPFFDFLVEQRDLGRDDTVGDLMKDYFYGVAASEDPIARTPEELREILEPYPVTADAYAQLAAEWSTRA